MKIAYCRICDWPILEKYRQLNMPTDYDHTLVWEHANIGEHLTAHVARLNNDHRPQP